MKIGGNIQIAAWRELKLQAGDTVSLHVIKQLSGDKWAVGLHGRVLPATTTVSLEAGSTLRARVSILSGRMVLTILHSQPDPVVVALRRQGLAGDEMTRLIAAALLRGGQSVRPEIVERIRQLVERSSLPKDRAARILAALLDKGIDISGPGIPRMVEALDFSNSQGDRGGKRRGRDLPKDAQSARSAIAALAAPGPPEQAGAAAVFNHIRATGESWVVLPFLFTEGEDTYPGTIKILFDPFQSKPLRMVLSVAPKGMSTLDFDVGLGPRKSMSVYAPDGQTAARVGGLLHQLTAKLRNLGVEVDDTIHGTGSFDGFSRADDGVQFQEVDTVG